jgi:uncharacterized protein
MPVDVLPPFAQPLLEPATYTHPVAEVQLVQTHISYVFLAGDYVYKFKKPVDFGFLDFTTLEKRRICCERELTLNSRLSPDIYLDLVTMNDRHGELVLNGPGEIVEYGVRMRRMPEERMMRRVIDRGELEARHIDALVTPLVPFYDQAERSPEIDGFGTAEGVGVNVLENFDQTQSFIGQGGLSRQAFDRISTYAKTILADQARFAERIRQGRIRDCHGDLYSANICLDTPVHIFDCIEFNDRFRYHDVASDIAFLAMDLDFHGLTDLSVYLVERFVAASQDSGLPEMLPFYKCYREYVRGKIGLFTAADPQVDESTKGRCLADCQRYFALAERYAAGD